MEHTGTDRALAARRLRGLGQRATPVRLDVLQVLTTADDHLEVPEIHRRLAGLPGAPARTTSLSAVYRTIDRLAGLGVVHGSPSAGGTAWGLALDAHSHATCDRCGRRVSLSADAVRAVLAGLDGLTGMRLVTVDAHGTCTDCSADHGDPGDQDDDGHGRAHDHRHGGTGQDPADRGGDDS